MQLCHWAAIPNLLYYFVSTKSLLSTTLLAIPNHNESDLSQLLNIYNI